MVIGLDIFRNFFKDHTDNYVIIGGTACDIHIEEAGLIPRATNDIDIILIIEALNSSFVKRFWDFVKEGAYAIQEKSTGQRNYYRFMKPANKDFPKQVELFARKPDTIYYEGQGQLTPIPSDSDLSSLSAILMHEEYYEFTITQSTSKDGLHQANSEALICLKAKAFLDMTERKLRGDNIDARDIKKHKSDIFRLALLLTPSSKFQLPKNIKSDLLLFVETVKNELPDKSIFKEMGATGANAEELLELIKSNFSLDN
jgi:hypothetical protein